jgi:hypothetical protein
MLLAKPNFWTDRQVRNTRLAFVESVRATVSTSKQLFFAPDFDTTDAMVIAYRLRRQIPRKPLISAARNDYFLVGSDVTNVPPGIEKQVLAFSKTDRISLVRVIAASAGFQNLSSIK